MKYIRHSVLSNCIPGGKGARRQGGKEARRQGGKEAMRQGSKGSQVDYYGKEIVRKVDNKRDFCKCLPVLTNNLIFKISVIGTNRIHLHYRL